LHASSASPRRYGRRVDEIGVNDVSAFIDALTDAGYKPETIKKSRDALAMTLDYHGVDPNPARDKRVKLPKQRKPHVPPPLAEHVGRVAETVPKHYILPLLIIDERGPRVRELETAQVGDLDEHCRAIRVRWTIENNEPWRPDSDRGGPDAPGRSHLPRRRGRAARAGR
jgi:hypothetical protein